MRKLAILLSVAALVITTGNGLSTAAEVSQSASAQVVYEDWTDSRRSRVIPVKIYLPKDRSKPHPVVIFSHGLGGSREAAQYLGEYWSGHGYVSVHVQHAGSDNSVWQPVASQGRQGVMGKMRSAINLQTFMDRNGDISFVLDQLEKLNKPNSKSRLQGQLDLSKIAMSGHSYGAATTLAMAGQRYVLGTNFTDPRVKAAIYLSPPVNLRGQSAEEVFGYIKVPGLLMTGTEDNSPMGETSQSARRIPFDAIESPNQYLVIFKGGDHMVFNGRPGIRAAKPTDALFHQQIQKVSTAFLDAYLKGDASQQSWLKTQAPTYFAKTAFFERK